MDTRHCRSSKAAALVVALHAIVSAKMTVQRQIFTAALLDDVFMPWHAVEDAESRDDRQRVHGEGGDVVGAAPLHQTEIYTSSQRYVNFR
jgi:hypothetical protein